MRKFLGFFFLLYFFSILIFSQAKENTTSQIERFRQILKYGNSQQVRESLVKIMRLSEEEQKSLLPELKELTQVRDALVQRRLVEAIGSFNFADLDEHLIQTLDHKSDEVFFATCAAIEKKKPPKAQEKIKEKILEADFTQAGNKIPDLLRALAVYPPSADMSNFLMEKLKDKNTFADYRNQILRYFAISKFQNQELNSLIVDIIQNEDEGITLQSYAVYAAGELNLKESKDTLLKRLEKIDNIMDTDEKKKYSRLRLQLISALIKLEAEGIDKILFEMARDDDETVRLRAIRQLAQFKRIDVKELLKFKAENDSSPRVQKEAQKLLENFDLPSSAEIE